MASITSNFIPKRLPPAYKFHSIDKCFSFSSPSPLHIVCQISSVGHGSSTSKFTSMPSNEDTSSHSKHQKTLKDISAEVPSSQEDLGNCFSASETRLSKGGHVAVIGAGVSGLAACKSLSEAGIHVTLFESRSDVGGVWSKTYPSTCLQTNRKAYRFSDYDWPTGSPDFPSHVQVVDYLRGYVDKFKLRDKISFNSRVLKIERVPRAGKGWDLTVESTKTGSHGVKESVIEKRRFDFVVNCCGCFGDAPNMPKFQPGEGPEVFQGTVLHSTDYSAFTESECTEILTNKKVLVVGFQKTAIDVVIEAATANQAGHKGQPATLLFRKPHWFVPREHLIFGMNLKYFTSTRFAELFFKRPRQGPLLTILQTLIPYRRIINAVVETYLRRRYPLDKYGLVPSHPFLEDASGCILPQMPPSFFPFLEANKIKLAQSSDWKFCPSGITMSSGRQLDADVVIMCTGYDSVGKLKTLLPKPYAENLAENGRNIYLYRGVIHPRVPYMAFLGFHEGLSSVHTSEMGSRWLAKLLSGSFSLPSLPDMERDRLQWATTKLEHTRFSGRVSCVVPIHAWHFDRLCGDMGWKLMRRQGPIENWFLPYTNADYAGDEEKEPWIADEANSQLAELPTVV